MCAGLARRFGWSPTAVRLLFLLSCLLPGPQFVIYLVMWVVIPAEPQVVQLQSSGSSNGGTATV